jgi:hypothetical protein
MKRIILLIICIIISVGSFAQGIRTKFTEGIRLTDFVGSTIHTFYSGESVTIHAYKKKSGRYHFLVETDNYATTLICNNIPFLVTEKELKKLPNALSNDADALLKERQQAVYQRQVRKEQEARLAKERAEAEAKAQYRVKALNGQIKGKLSSYARLIEDENGLHGFTDGDTVSIIGYSSAGNHHYYAMYSSRTSGTFNSLTPPSYMFVNDSDIDFRRLPSDSDPEVAVVLKRQSDIIASANKIIMDEFQKQVEESLVQRIQEYKENHPFIIDEISWSSNSVGGIYVSLDFFNCSNQTIKYVTFQGYFLNTVGDKCRNEIGGSAIWKARGIGPIGPCPTTVENHYERIHNCKASYDFDELTFYTRSADTFRLSSVTVQYMNGKTITLSGANLNKHVRY